MKRIRWKKNCIVWGEGEGRRKHNLPRNNLRTKNQKSEDCSKKWCRKLWNIDQVMSSSQKTIQVLVEAKTNLISLGPTFTHTLSPLTMYSPSWTCSTPPVALNTRSWLSSKIRLMVWSNPRNVPLKWQNKGTMIILKKQWHFRTPRPGDNLCGVNLKFLL